jgi:copper chaperone CopZ
MLNIFKKKPKGEQTVFKIKGMHCTSCAMNIDGALEDTEGVFSSKTSYAQSKVEIEYDKSKVSLKQLSKVIEDQGYSVVS